MQKTVTWMLGFLDQGLLRELLAKNVFFISMDVAKLNPLVNVKFCISIIINKNII